MLLACFLLALAPEAQFGASGLAEVFLPSAEDTMETFPCVGNPVPSCKLILVCVSCGRAAQLDGAVFLL